MRGARGFRFRCGTVLLLAVLFAFPDVCLASFYQIYQTDCRLVLIDLMTECNVYARQKMRDKRGMEKFDLQKMDFKKPRFRKTDEAETSSEEFHEPPEKRSVNIPDPIADMLKHFIRIPQHPEKDRSGIDPRLLSANPEANNNPVGKSLLPGSMEDDFLRAVRSSLPEDILGFQFSEEETDENYDRTTRGSNKKERERSFMRCCMDLDYCRTHAKTLVCPHVLLS